MSLPPPGPTVSTPPKTKMRESIRHFYKHSALLGWLCRHVWWIAGVPTLLYVTTGLAIADFGQALNILIGDASPFAWDRASNRLLPWATPDDLATSLAVALALVGYLLVPALIGAIIGATVEAAVNRRPGYRVIAGRIAVTTGLLESEIMDILIQAEEDGE